MISIAFAILIVLGALIWSYNYYKLGKIYDELKEIRKEKKKVKRGKWFDEYGVHKCSCCNGNALVVCDQDLETFEYMSDFCPWCGADMWGKEDDDIL